MIERDGVSVALDEAGVPWKERAGGWVIPASARVPCEIDIAASDTEVTLEALLATWDAIGTRERSALSRYLATAEMAGVSFVMGERRATAVATVTHDRDIAGAVGRLLAAARLTLREAAALLEPDVGGHYLSFFGAPA